MKLPRLLIPLSLLALWATLLAACGDGLRVEPPSPSVTRAPVQAPTAPGLPTEVAAAAAAVTEVQPTQAPPTTVPTEVPPGNLQPMGAPTEAAPEPTATPEPTLPPAPLAPLEFSPAELVPGGAAIVYFNEPATAATLTFGAKQYPMLFDGTRWWAIVGIGAFSEAGTAPLTVAYNPAVGGGQDQISGEIPILFRQYEVENIDLDPGTSALLDPTVVNNEEALRATIFSGYTTQRLWDGAFIAPANSAISSSYGIARSYNNGPVTSYHRGTDFIGGPGDPVFAAAAGRVVYADELKVRGNSIVVDHGVGVFTTYSHLSQIGVGVGEMVEAGQLIGQIGSTGLVTGPHLHWEVVVRGVEVDGELWLSGAVGP